MNMCCSMFSLFHHLSKKVTDEVKNVLVFLCTVYLLGQALNLKLCMSFISRLFVVLVDPPITCYFNLL